MTDDRLDGIQKWLLQFDDLAGAKLSPASGDASFRRYFRAECGDVSRIIMDAPPGQEDCGPFIKVASHFELMGLNAPRVIASDLDLGYLLLSDLGSSQYLDQLQAEPSCAGDLYGDAIDSLLVMQNCGRVLQSELPQYNETLLRFELSIFSEWLCGTHLGLTFSDSDICRWIKTCDQLVAIMLEQSSTYVHRDFHSRNLMYVDENNPGILDFQDAVCGPYAYDVVSLLKDCYIEWPAETIRPWALSYFENSELTAELGEDEFIRHFDLTGAQRHLKAAGIFSRLKHRDGKSGYMKDIPRTLNYIVAIGNDYPELEFVAELITRRILPALSTEL